MTSVLASPSCMEIYQMSSHPREKTVDNQEISNLFLLCWSKATSMQLSFRRKKTNLNSVVVFFENHSMLTLTLFYYCYNK